MNAAIREQVMDVENYVQAAEISSDASKTTGLCNARGSAKIEGHVLRCPQGDVSFPAGRNAKTALLALMEVHSSLKQLESECSKACLTKDRVSTMPEWRIGTQACGDEEEICTEIMAPPSRMSSGMLEAVSIVPNALDLEVDFDSNNFGFWQDVGVDCRSPDRGCYGEEAGNFLVSEENIMPWDL